MLKLFSGKPNNIMIGIHLEHSFIKNFLNGNVAFTFSLIQYKKKIKASVPKFDFEINDIYTFE